MMARNKAKDLCIHQMGPDTRGAGEKTITTAKEPTHGPTAVSTLVSTAKAKSMARALSQMLMVNALLACGKMVRKFGEEANFIAILGLSS